MYFKVYIHEYVCKDITCSLRESALECNKFASLDCP